MIRLELPDEILDEIAARVASRVIDALPETRSNERDEAWRLLSLAEAAERLGRSTRWVRDRAKRGDLPYVRLDGGALAFDLADLQAFARSRRVSARECSETSDPARRAGLRRLEAVENRRVAG